ncbi:MAG TPA: SUF system NifU family Fe-S cluster assembly protein [Woeseiaceae bacterium]|nr:SUF system NifU family Fe-S cluster assembly protein [Woeseiaceae bacterium]
MSKLAELNTDDLKDLYRELILDHARNPRNFGPLRSATHRARGANPLCGDTLELYLELDADEVVRAARFEGTGCAISLASASLLTETVAGLPRHLALQWFEQVTASLTGGRSEFDLGKLMALQGVREFPARVKCATLPWHTMRSAFQQQATTATTTTE